MKIELESIKIAMAVRWGNEDKNWLDITRPNADYSITFDSGLIYVLANDGKKEIIIPLPNIIQMIRKKQVDKPANG